MKIGDVQKRLNQISEGSILYIGKIRDGNVVHVLTKYRGYRIPESVKNHIELNNYVKGYIWKEGKIIPMGETKCVCANTPKEDCVESMFSDPKDIEKILKKHFGELGEEVLRSAGLS